VDEPTTPPASGRILLRMPATLHNELRRMAIEVRERMIWEGWARMFR
jgi:hypothetical protein